MDYLKLNELYHHGIKGQKWGIRKYQNEDGTLTKEGQTRYNKTLEEDDDAKLYEKYAMDSEIAYYDYIEDDYNPKTYSKKKEFELAKKRSDDYEKYEEERLKSAAEHQKIQKRIDAGEQVYKNIDPEILNGFVKSDEELAEQERAKRNQTKQKVKNILTMTLSGVTIASILGYGAYITYKENH